MKTTPADSVAMSENFSSQKGPTPEQARVYTRVSMVADMLEGALQDGMEGLHYTLILIADGALLEFDAFLQGRAEALLKSSTEVYDKLFFLFTGRHGAEEHKLLNARTLSLEAEVAIYRKTARKQKFPTEEVRAAEAAYSLAVELYAQVECFMRAIDSYSEGGPDIHRVGAPRFSTLIDLPEDRRVSA
jgi:hypothetical protein